MRIDAGPVEAIPTDHCVAVGDGTAVLVRCGERVLAYQNRCLHQDSPLEGGRVTSGKLQCPMHFWRYELPDGRHLGGRGCLATYPTTIQAGRVLVDLPDPEPARSLREQLLARARSWDRGD